MTLSCFFAETYVCLVSAKTDRICEVVKVQHISSAVGTPYAIKDSGLYT